MPVPTETFWNIRKLNVIFALSAVALLGSIGWLVMEDWNRTWRTYQRDARVWETAMTRDAQAHAMTAEDERELAELRAEIQRLKESLPEKQIEEDEAKLAKLTAERDPLVLRTAVVKGEITPRTQQLEEALLNNSPEAGQIQKDLERITREYEDRSGRISDLEREMGEINK